MNVIILFRLLRIHHWTKSTLCFAGVFFGGHIQNVNFWLIALNVFILFSIASSSIYIFNDIIDRQKDSKHPKKKLRPIAKGEVSLPIAILIGLALLFLGLIGAYIINYTVFVILSLYIINNILYSIHLKNTPIIDVLSIAFGYILRLISGIYVINDKPTAWIILCTMFLALFLGFSKRRAELISVKKTTDEDFLTRPVLKRYNLITLDSFVNESSLGAVLTYALFTITSGKNPTLVITVPIVYYAMMHYKRLLFLNRIGEEPDLAIYNDKIILICILSWLILSLLIIQFEFNILS